MRPIFNQYGGCCAQAAGVAYTYTYEVNYLRNLRADSSIYEQNWYPTHYTWNFLNGGDGDGSNYYDGWDIIMQNGCPNVPTCGGMAGSSIRWLSGYDEHLSAIENKIESYFSIDITSPAGLEILKHWLYNHNDSNQGIGGLGCFSIAMNGIEYDNLPLGYPNARRSIIKDWNYSTSAMHAMTFVGFNDSIRFDINNDSIYSNTMDTNNDGIVDMQDWEIGALIVANSHGDDYPEDIDKGFVYFPYRLLAKQGVS